VKIQIVICYLLLLSCVPAFAETSLNGYIELDERIKTQDYGGYYWNRTTLGLITKAAISDQVAGYGELRFRTLNFPRVSQGNDLIQRDKVSPLEMELRQAYVDVFGSPFRNMDLRAGKQRIAWGTADKLNQTDNLNPYDFSDLLEFGEKIPTNALKLTTYAGNNTLTAVFIPVFTPAIMPDNYSSLITSVINNALPREITLVTVETKVILPENKIENSMYAIKFARNILGFDMSISYFDGRDSLPDPERVIFTGLTTVAATVIQNYPKIRVIGYDLAGSIGGVGVWAEAALIKPDNLKQYIITPLETQITEITDYSKFTLGCDYTFPNGLYLNSQFMHGFLDERGENLSNMLQMRIEKKILDEKIKLACTWLSDVELKETKKIIGNFFGPSITWYPADATEILLESISIDGDPGSKLSFWKTLDQVVLKVKYSF